MGFFKNLFKLTSEPPNTESDTDNENITREEKSTWKVLQEDGEKNGWGSLITFYDSENYKEIHNFGKFAVYEKCLIFDDEHSGRLMVPRNSFISNKPASNVCRIDVDMKDDNWVKINLYLDTNLYKWYSDVNITFHYIFIKKTYINMYKQISTKIDKLMYWYYGIKAENPDNLADYNDFIEAMNKYRDAGFEMISYPVDINGIDTATYLWQLDNLIVLGKHPTTLDFLLYSTVHSSAKLKWMESHPEYKKEIQKKYSLYRKTVKAAFTFSNDEFLSYSVSGTKDTYLHYNSNDVPQKDGFSPTRAAVGYALAGPVGTLAIGFKKSKLPLGSYTVSVSDYRRIYLKMKDGDQFGLPYELLGVMQKFYPEKEEIVFKQL